MITTVLSVIGGVFGGIVICLLLLIGTVVLIANAMKDD